jgi:hypothetical protein
MSEQPEHFKPNNQNYHPPEPLGPTSTMEFRYSHVIPPSTYNTRGLCPGMEVRLPNTHRETDLSIIGALEDWRELIGPVPGIYKGGLHALYSSVPISLPECLPDRLSIIAYATEFGFLEDDTFENDDAAHGAGILSEAMQAIADMNSNRTASFMLGAGGRRSAKNARKMQAWIISKMLAIDPVRGKQAMNAWQSFLEWGGGGAASKKEFDKLDEYIDYRFEDVGIRYWAGMIVFGCALTISPEEMVPLEALCRPGWVAFFMVNDVCSFDKEERDAKLNGWGYVSNAIWVIAKEQGLKLAVAKERGAQMLNELAAEFISRVEAAKKEAKLSRDALCYMDALYYSISGSLVWSVTCPRYNPHCQFSKRQVDWILNGVPNHLRRMDSMKSTAYTLEDGAKTGLTRV